MLCLCLRQCRLARSTVRPFVRFQTCEYDILKTNQAISMRIGTRGPWGKGVK